LHEPLQHANWHTWFNATFISLILRWYVLLAYADYLVHRWKAEWKWGWVSQKSCTTCCFFTTYLHAYDEQQCSGWLTSQIGLHNTCNEDITTSTMQVTTSRAKLQSDLHFVYSQLSDSPIITLYTRTNRIHYRLPVITRVR
jgi:hypothetical protein